MKKRQTLYNAKINEALIDFKRKRTGDNRKEVLDLIVTRFSFITIIVNILATNLL